MLWPNWIVNLLRALPTATNFQEKYTACTAEKRLLSDEIALLKDEIRILKKKLRDREIELDQYRPSTIDAADELILYMLAGDADDYVAPETIAERVHVNRHEIVLRMDALASSRYLTCDQGEYALTPKARIYLQRAGALDKLSNERKG